MAKKGPWTEAETQFLRDNFGKLTNNDIAEQLDRKPISVCGAAYRLGLIKKKRKYRKAVDEVPEVNVMDALQTCHNALEPLAPGERTRVINAVRILLDMVKPAAEHPAAQ